MRPFTGTLVFLTLAVPLVASEPAVRRPRLDLRASPRVALSPALVHATAELAGGDEIEDFYCPELEWDWDDGARSVHGSDCAPFEPGSSPFDRFFTADHAYRQAGTYEVRITMRRAGRTLAVARSTVNLRPGLGDLSE